MKVAEYQCISKRKFSKNFTVTGRMVMAGGLDYLNYKVLLITIRDGCILRVKLLKEQYYTVLIPTINSFTK